MEEDCESCRMSTDGIEEHHIFEYREHQICSWCQALWKHKEERIRREISWDEFRKGKLEKI